MSRQRDLALAALGASLARPRTEYVTRTVHEHKAPTDESVRLLAEMEEKARDRVLAVIPLEANGLAGKLVVEQSPMDMSVVLIALVEVNGKRLRVEHRAEQHRDTPQTSLAAIRDKIAEKIAVEFLTDALTNNREVVATISSAFR